MTPKFKPVLKATRSSRLKNMSYNDQLKRQNFKCFYCDTLLDMTPTNKPTQDHFFPRSHGFSLNGNKVISCWKCNQIKKNNYPSTEMIIKFFNIMTPYFRRRSIISMQNNKPKFKMILSKDIKENYMS